MPTSTNYFKVETIQYIVKNHRKDIKILDVGPGVGTYSDLLKSYGYENIDCVEAFDGYVNDYNLSIKYNKVFVSDVTESNIDFNIYDLIIFGDVLEHIDVEKAKKLINSLTTPDVIVAIPFESEQGEHYGNKYEIHLQSDLTISNFLERYDGFYPYCVRFDYGIFVKKKQNLVYIEKDEFPLTKNQLSYLSSFYPECKLIDIYGEYNNIINDDKKKTMNNHITIVTGLWDIGRDKLNNGWSRSYKHYIDKLTELLKIDNNLIIFGDEELQKYVRKYRDNSNTQFILRNTDWFKNNEYYDKIQNIRLSEDWFNQVAWLKDSTQSQLEFYNPLVMSKMFLLNDARIMDRFNSDYMFWIDAGITNTVHPGYFTHDKVLDKLSNYLKNFTFIAFPYDAETEIHGFKYTDINQYAGNNVKLVGRGGFFGGHKDLISDINGIYYSLLNETLNNNLMGTEESLFSILLYKYPDLTSYFEIEKNGLISTFFEDLKNDRAQLKQTVEIISNSPTVNYSVPPSITYNNVKTLSDGNNVGLYVIGFNSPNQLKTLIDSMLAYDEDFIKKPRKILLDNSTDLSTTPIYSEICSEYGFEHIKKDNLGICGGRQWIAEHFEKSGLDYMYFFEDDMFFYPKKGEVCRNGFNRYVPNLFDKSLSIIQKENFDFLKLNFTEFFGDNSTQWSWYNVPQNVREEYWPDNCKLPEMGTSENAPKTKYDSVRSYEGVPYVTGEVYYCNWPQVVSKEGSKKMFLETTWAHPYEQTWMSYMYQETKKGNLNGGLLLMTPTEHNRFDHYSRELRKES